MAFNRIAVEPAAGALGAEISGVDLAGPLDNETFDEIYRAFLDHAVVFFRDQRLDTDQYLAFANRFGAPTLYPFSEGIPGYPHVFEILKEADQKQNFGGAWHSDGTYLERPPLGTMLHCHEAPPYGGDTQYASTERAYERLSDGMKALVDGLIGVNSAGLKNSGGRQLRGKLMTHMSLSNLDTADAIEARHPVVRTHPGTGRKGLYVNRSHTIRFDGWTEEESKPLIDWLCDHIVRPEHTCRFAWRPGTVGFWDNRCTQHFAINDYSGHRRRMHRITVGPEVPA